MPEHPVVRTPSLTPIPLPRRARKLVTCCAARSVIVTGILMTPSGRLLVGSHSGMLFLIVADRSLDGVLREDRAVNLDRRQRELFSDLRVLQLHCLVKGLALDPFR